MTMSKTITHLLLAILSMALLVAASNELVKHPINDWLTWGALTYPFTFFITDICNRKFSINFARKVIYAGFIVGVLLSIFIDIRIAIASGSAFLIAQLIDAQIFNMLKSRAIFWWVAPFTSSMVGAIFDTVLFFSIAFYGTGLPWVSWGVGDFAVKSGLILLALLPYRLLLPWLKSEYKTA